jgi:hypothetical protein
MTASLAAKRFLENAPYRAAEAGAASTPVSLDSIK